MNQQERKQMYVELGRNFAAAYVAYQMGIRSIDYAKKSYVSEQVGDFWVKLAESIDRQVQEARSNGLIPLPEESGEEPSG